MRVVHKVTVEVFRSPWKVYDKGAACGRKEDLITMTKSWATVTCKKCLKKAPKSARRETNKFVNYEF